MSAICFRTTTKGNLPHLSYIFRIPDPLGTEFNTVTCSVTGSLILIEVQRIKENVYLVVLLGAPNSRRPVLDIPRW